VSTLIGESRLKVAIIHQVKLIKSLSVALLTKLGRQRTTVTARLTLLKHCGDSVGRATGTSVLGRQLSGLTRRLGVVVVQCGVVDLVHVRRHVGTDPCRVPLCGRNLIGSDGLAQATEGGVKGTTHLTG